VRKLLQATIGLVAFVEAMAFFLGTALHLGVPLPVPFVESRSLVSAALEAASGVILLIAVAAIATQKRSAWEVAVASHVVGVASIAFGIAVRGTGFGAQSSHHPPMLLVLIVVLIALSTPPCRHALGSGRRRSKRRRRVLQTL
jgi:hypothetical protein